jgi:hypothetical protein
MMVAVLIRSAEDRAGVDQASARNNDCSPEKER